MPEMNKNLPKAMGLRKIFFAFLRIARYNKEKANAVFAQMWAYSSARKEEGVWKIRIKKNLAICER